MKLGSYFQKPVQRKVKQNTPIIVSNERIKQEFDVQRKTQDKIILELRKQVEISRNGSKNSEALYNDLQRRHQKALDQIEAHTELDAENFGLRTELGQTKQEAVKVNPLEHQLKQLTEQYTTIQTAHSGCGHNINVLHANIAKYETQIATRIEQIQKLISELAVYKDESAALLVEKTNFQQDLQALNTQVAQQLEDINLLSTNFLHWKDTAKIWESQLQDEAQLREEIQQSLIVITAEKTLESKRSEKTGEAKQEADNMILALNTRNLDLTKFTEQLSKIIVEQKKLLATAGYLSQGAIGKKEGFNMPFAKENIRTVNLGNSAPTMLKFKETSNDDN